MTYVYATLALLLGLGIVSYFKTRRERQTGKDEEKLIQSQETIKNVEKTKSAWDRLSDAQRDELRTKYGRSE